MLKTEMIDKLNAQMNLELFSSLLYQQMSAWCSYHSFEGAAAFLRRHAQEEMTHMQSLFDYLTDTGSLPRIAFERCDRFRRLGTCVLFRIERLSL